MFPTAPLKKAMGTKTATSTAVMPTMAPPICFMAFTVARRASRPSSIMMRYTFSTTTMASSQQGYGNDERGNQGGPEVLEEQEHDQEHQQDGFQQG